MALLPRRLICLLLATLCCGWCAPGRGGASVVLGQIAAGWIDDDGAQLSFSGLRGHRVVLTMGYANCHRICPMTIDALQRMQRRADALREAVEFVVVGYDPENDSPEVWRAYRSRHHLNRANWHFLQGSPAAVEQLARQMSFPFWRYDEHVMHESRAILFDTRGVEQAALGTPVSAWPDAL